MAYVRTHLGAPGKDGKRRVYRYLTWRGRDGKRKTSKLGPVSAAVAKRAAERKTEEVGDRPPPREAVAPLKALRQFLKAWEEQRARSKSTVRFYRYLLTPLVRFMAARGPMRSWTLRGYEAYVATKEGYGARSVQMLTNAARLFSKWARRHGYACADFARDFEGPRVERPRREAYTAEEAARLLAGARGHVLERSIALALLAGQSWGDLYAFDRDRSKIAAALRSGWITGPRSKIRQKDQLVPVGKMLREVLTRTQEDERTLPREDSSYRPWKRLCERTKVGEEKGKPVYLSPSGGFKRLRHTFSTLLDAAGVDHTTRSVLMGHAPRTMTDRYTHTDQERLREGIEALERALTEKTT